MLPPTAVASADQSVVVAGTDITLSASESRDTDGSIVSYLWTDNNGVEVGIGEVVTLAGLAVGNYTVHLLVTDNGGATATSSVSFTVNAIPNMAPIAAEDTSEAELGNAVTIAVLSNDSDPDDDDAVLTVTAAIDGVLGTTVVEADGRITYSNTSGSAGDTDTFSYTIADAAGATDTATVTVTLLAAANIDPIASNDTADVEAGGSATISVLSNDEDQDGDVAALTVTTTDGALGTTLVESDGSVTYSNTSGSAGDTDTFSYMIEDEAEGTDTATVTVTLLAAANIDPIASNDTADVEIGGSVTISVLANDEDQDGDVAALTVTATDGALGTTLVESDGRVTYSNTTGVAGDEDTFTYTIADASGATDTATVTVTLMAAANIDPIASDDSANVEAGGSVTISVLANDEDQGGDVAALTVTATDGALGTTLVESDGSITYSNTSGSAGDTDTFTYTITDAAGGTDTATVTLTLVAPAVAPMAVDDSVLIAAGSPALIDVLSNDTAATGAIVAAGPLQPSHGSISIDPTTGVITYTAGHMATIGAVDQFSYTLENSLGLISNPATVTVTLVPGAMVHTHHEMVPNPVYNSDFRVADACRGVSQSCQWSDPATWLTSTVPDGSSLVIVDGHVQITDRNAQARSIGIYPGGKLTFAPNANTQLNVADLLVFKNAELEIGTASSPIGSNFSAEVVFTDLPFDSNDSEQHLRGLITLDGTVAVHGRQLGEVFIRSSGEPSSGDNVIALEQSASGAGWRVGDSVVIPNSTQCAVASNNGCPDLTEERTISSISGNSVTLSQSLQFDHPGARDHNGVLDFTPHVVNKSRNVVFRSENPQGTRGHLLLHGRSDIDIRYAEFRSLGRTDIRNLGASNQKGRYPIHAHHLIGTSNGQSNGYQFTLVGNTVDFGQENHQQDRKWGLTIHGSHYGLIERNIVYRASGAGIVTESGEEVGNRFSRNFVVSVVGGNGERQHDPDPGDGSKLGRAGSAYWFNGGGAITLTITLPQQ